MKTCTKCGQAKPPGDFHRSQRRKDGTRYGDGRRSICKECSVQYDKEMRESWTDARRKEIVKKNTEALKKRLKDKPWYKKAAAANLHAKRVGATGVLTREDVGAVWTAWNGRCWVCGVEVTEIDHYRPINGNGGGTNTSDNIRPICRECNQKRSHEWHGDDIAVKEANLLRQIKELLNGTH